MNILYDTTKVGAPDRFDHYRAGCLAEVAPIAVDGPAPRRLSATLEVGWIGGFQVSTFDGQADSDIVVRRTERLIRVGDPDWYRLILTVGGEVRLEQGDRRVRLRPGDIGLFDLSRPCKAIDLAGPGKLGTVMLTFPRTLLAASEADLRSLGGTCIPRRLRGRGLMARLLGGLPGIADSTGDDVSAGTGRGSGHAELLSEYVTAMIHAQLGQHDAVTARTRLAAHRLLIDEAVRTSFGDPDLKPDHIARKLHISLRTLQKLCQATDTTPARLVKRTRLTEGRRRLTDPARRTALVTEIAKECGYPELDQFSRDFRIEFGVAPSHLRDNGEEI